MNSMTQTEHKFTNRLINESSPYLLQHAHNPVDWYPWGDEALEKAKREDKPIFLSIGYAACHWCHVMEHESFENEAVAEVLNTDFVAIKVDREQRPDIDQIYMAATQAMTGSGGWPMSVFLAPDLKPFYAGTYFPPEDAYGRPGFKHLLTEIAKVYKNDREKINDVSTRIVNALADSYRVSDSTVELDQGVVERAVSGLMQNYDRVNGGFGGAPKFPHGSELSFLIKYAVTNKDDELLEAVIQTLKKMAQGGIYDQIGGGFHRYSVDEKWLVPHFEKMLYDNALLAVVYSEAFLVTGDEFYRKIVRETLDFVIREMTDKNGGFYSSLDADSEGEEGKYYVWSKDEVDRLLGDKSELFAGYYNITKGGNFEHGKNIPNIDKSSEDYRAETELAEMDFDNALVSAIKILFEERSKRERPFTDDKILTSWNGLMISGFARGFRITRDNRYHEAARRSAEFIRKNLYDDGNLVHSYRKGQTSSGRFLEDYAYLITGLIDLYEITHDYSWIEFASELGVKAGEMFSDKAGNLYLSPSGMEDHYMRPRDIADGAVPSPGSMLISGLARLTDITGDKRFNLMTREFLAAISSNVYGAPYAMTSAVTAVDYLNSERIQVVVVGRNNDEFLDEIYRRYIPNSVLIVSENGGENVPLLEGRKANGSKTAFICRNYTCNLPAESLTELKQQLNGI